MKLHILIIIFGLSNISYADLQSDFQSRIESLSVKKVVEPEKTKAALKLIEKKIGSTVEKSENVQSYPYQTDIDSKKFPFYIDQLIFVKFKNNIMCRAQLATFQNQPIYRSLRVICIDEKNKLQTFEETL